MWLTLGVMECRGAESVKPGCICGHFYVDTSGKLPEEITGDRDQNLQGSSNFVRFFSRLHFFIYIHNFTFIILYSFS